MPGITWDGYGMHARTCACAVCEAGYRPTESQRQEAVRAAERERLRVVKTTRAAERKEQTRAAVAATTRRIEAARAFTPPTPEEMEEIKQLARGFKR